MHIGHWGEHEKGNGVCNQTKGGENTKGGEVSPRKSHGPLDV